MMAESGTPAACIFAILSFAGWEKLQPSMLQLATVSGQPHWQASLAPTRRISCLTLAIWAQAAVVRTSRRVALLLNWNMLLGDAYNFRPRVLQLDFARDQCDERAEDQDDAAGPDPTDQWEHVGLNDRLVVLELSEIQVQIFVHAAADGYASHRLAACLVELARWLACVQELSALVHVDRRSLPGVIFVVAVPDFFYLQVVIADLERLADFH